MMTMKDRVASALHTAIAETQWSIRELSAAVKRRDNEAIDHWLATADYWTKRALEFEKQLKEVNG